MEKPFYEYVKHNSLKHQSNKSIINVLQDGGIDIEAIAEGQARLHIFEGLKYEANAESGLENDFIYATNNFNRSGNTRHDFVSLQLEDDDGNVYHQIAIVLLCLQYFIGNTSMYFIVVQSLEEDKLAPKPRYRSTHFTVWKWERGLKKYRNHRLGCFSTDSIAEVACVVPMYIRPYLDENHATKASKHDT
jgi:hypothetical protein